MAWRFFHGSIMEHQKKPWSICHCYGNDYRQPNRPNKQSKPSNFRWRRDVRSLHVSACHCMSLHPDCQWKPDVILLFVGKIPILFLQYTHQVTTVSCLSPCLIENYDVYHFFPGKCQFWLVNSPLKQHDHNMIFHGMPAWAGVWSATSPGPSPETSSPRVKCSPLGALEIFGTWVKIKDLDHPIFGVPNFDPYLVNDGNMEINLCFTLMIIDGFIRTHLLCVYDMIW